MCAYGSLQYTGTTSGYYTNGAEYPILAVSSNGAGPASGYYVIRADNGALGGVAGLDPDFLVTSLYAPVKVV